jgi:hypothetical protein
MSETSVRALFEDYILSKIESYCFLPSRIPPNFPVLVHAPQFTFALLNRYAAHALSLKRLNGLLRTSLISYSSSLLERR